MIKSSTLNFVREKAQEGAQWAELHAQLSDISKNTTAVKAEQKKLEDLKAARVKVENEVKAAQEQVNAAHFDQAAVHRDRDNARKEADMIIANAEKNAKEILAEIELQRKQSIAGWDKAIDERKHVLDALDGQVDSVATDLTHLQKSYTELKQKHDTLASKHDQLVGALAAMKSSL